MDMVSATISKNPTRQGLRKSRFAFTIEKDIFLMKTVLSLNPWQTGKSKWNDVAMEMKRQFKIECPLRTVRSRINSLNEKYNKQLLKYTTGCEEQFTERGILIQEIIAIIEEESMLINNVIDADCSNENVDERNNLVSNENYNAFDQTICNNTQDGTGNYDYESNDHNNDHSGADGGDINPNVYYEDDFVGIISENENEVRELEVSTLERTKSTHNARNKKQERMERNIADEERRMYVDEADGPNRKRKRKNFEEIAIQKREEHEMQVDIEKLKLENIRLEIEKMREIRLEEESRRRDKIMETQLNIQAAMIELIKKLMEKI